METIKKPGFVACFVNTDQAPISRKFVCLRAQETPASAMDTPVVSVEVLEEVKYRHPDAPDDAVVTILEWRPLKRVGANTQEAAAYRALCTAHGALKYQLSREFVFND